MPEIMFKTTKASGKKDVDSAILWTKRYSSDCIPMDLEDYKKDLQYRKKRYITDPPEEKYMKDFIRTAWSGEGFGIGTIGSEETKYLTELYECFQTNNIVISSLATMPNNPFARAGLAIMIADRVSQDWLDSMYSADKEAYDLAKYVKKIGTAKLLAKYGNKNGYRGDKFFSSCTPRWIDYDNEVDREIEKKKDNTKYDVEYWVNYSDDDDNSGWYTVEEIREWMKGKKKLIEIRKG
jgi:hypothetical protein